MRHCMCMVVAPICHGDVMRFLGHIHVIGFYDISCTGPFHKKEGLAKAILYHYTHTQSELCTLMGGTTPPINKTQTSITILLIRQFQRLNTHFKYIHSYSNLATVWRLLI